MLDVLWDFWCWLRSLFRKEEIELPPSPPEPKYLFHHVYPVPEHCGEQMRPEGNMSLHVLSYRCVVCLKQVEVSATFTDCGLSRTISPEVRAAIDDTP